jgi:RNA polymerase sigma factor (sigma-70 family)
MMAAFHTLEQDQGTSSPAISLATEIEVLLEQFDGEPTFKRLFWGLLSYDRVREPLPLSFIPARIAERTISLEVFADSEALTIVHVLMHEAPDGFRLEQMCWSLKRHIPNCAILLNSEASWMLVYPDESTKPRIRLLPLPGDAQKRTETAHALVAMDAADYATGDALPRFDVAEQVDRFFPGAMPHLDDLFDDFERIKQHPNPEVRDLFLFIREAGKYPLLTPAQERGEDIPSNDTAEDGEGFNYHQRRLVVHNLRLVLWMARHRPRVGMDLGDLVQEGNIGLMIAAKRFDPALGNRFTTYAFYWIRQSMLRGLHNGCNLIRWPVWIAPKLITACIDGNEEGLEAGEKPVVFVPWRLSLVSLRAVNLDDSLVVQEIEAAVRRVLLRLKPIQASVIRLRFGIGVDHEHTLEEIGQKYSLTRERIRQIEADGLKKLDKVGRDLTAFHEASQWRISKRGFPSSREEPPTCRLRETVA